MHPNCAPINRIIPMSMVDGPGSRMAIFLQGCNMKCQYCHNPETQALPTQKPAHQKLFITPDEIFCKIQKYADFLNGITLSGGECTLYSPFINVLFQKIKSNSSLTTFIDTNGLMPDSVLDTLSNATDGFMFDLKAISKEIHLKLTQTDNSQILKNISKTASRKLLYEIRTVLVEDFNDSPQEITKICNFISQETPGTPLVLIRFRPNGVKTSLKRLLPYDKEKANHLYSLSKELLCGISEVFLK